MTAKELPFRDVYEWSIILTAEQRYLPPSKYLPSAEARNLLRRLRTAGGQLIAVIGNQGTGKTVLRDILFLKLQNDKALTFKWIGKDPIKAVFKREGFGEKYYTTIINAFIETLSGDSTEEGPKVLGFKRGTDAYINYYHAFWNWKNREYERAYKLYDIIPLMEKKLGHKQVSEIRYEYFIEEIRKYRHLLIDFPDYDRRSRGQMLKDLKAFQEWWENIVSTFDGYNQQTNIMIFFQNELWGGHFSFGKFHVIELKPFPASKLAWYYEQRFGSPAPFDHEALELLARLGRGTFRWFKKYIGICLDHYYAIFKEGKSLESITKERVNEWITLGQLVEDWERELVDIFPKSKGLRKIAVKLLRFLAEKGAVSQPELVAKLFDGADMRCSRVLNALEDHGYIEREYEGRHKMVEIAKSRRAVL